jgi:hypothetical protein
VFAASTTAARAYTFPVVASFRRWDEKVDASVGTFVVLNDNGWIATAAHMLNIGQRMVADRPQVAALRQEIADVEANPDLKPGYRARQLRQLHGKAKPDWLVKTSYWWAVDGVVLQDVRLVPAVDLAIGKLDPFPRNVFSTHAVIKNPAVGLDPGTSLCRLGFPFPQIQATYDEVANAFRFDVAGLTYFPIDGIFTRIVDQGVVPGATFSGRWIETSSPGLRGQSGGPVYDTRGRLWGIQSKTIHIPLGFDPEITVQGKQVKEHQFINLGLALHPQSLIEVLTDQGVPFEMSAD